MRRRDLFKSAAAAAALPSTSALRLSGASEPAIEPKIVRLKLRHTWTTVMSSSEFRDTLHLRYTRDGITGTG